VCIIASRQQLWARRWSYAQGEKESPTWEDLRHQVKFTFQGALGDITNLLFQLQFTCFQKLFDEGKRHFFSKGMVF
jgi:hypothetical protein